MDENNQGFSASLDNIPSPEEITLEDFQKPEIYDGIARIEIPYFKTQAIAAYSLAAQRTGYGRNNFKKALKEYSSLIPEAVISSANFSHFPGQPIELDLGKWDINPDGGISQGNDEATQKPILITKRIINLDSGIHFLEVAFTWNDGINWEIISAQRSILLSPQKVTCLCDMGLPIEGQMSKNFVRYLGNLERNNYGRIPESKGIGKLGYIENAGFSPFIPGVVFNADPSCRKYYDAVTQPKGTFHEWKRMFLEAMNDSIESRIYLTGSFASVLVQPLGINPFFIHLWGSSGTGKTVALMVAASAWGNPENLILSLNSTRVGLERSAAFFNNVPLFLNELQLNTDDKGRSRFDVYFLTEGTGKQRGNKLGGIDERPTWKNCFLSNGETPMTNGNAAAGALNRVIDIQIIPGRKIIQDGHKTAELARQNYGHAGRIFAQSLYSPGNLEKARKLYADFLHALTDRDVTEKQASAAAAILTADALMKQWIFPNDELQPLTVEQIQNYLIRQSDISDGKRAHEYLQGWLSSHVAFFQPGKTAEVYGELDESGRAWIIRKVFNEAMENAGFNPTATLAYLRSKGYIDTRGKGYTKSKRIQGIPTDCICLLTGTWTVARSDETEEIPF